MPEPEAEEPQLAANALITLEEARSFLGKREEESSQDVEIARLIDSASEEIQNHCRREFAPAGEDEEERVFAYVGGRHIDLAPYDLREASAVTLGTDLEGEIELAIAEYRLRPLPARDGVYQSIRFRTPPEDDVRLALPEGESQFEVTVKGKWGFAEVPQDVRHWCKVTVATWLRKDVAAFSTTLRLEEDRLERPDALPTAAARGLKKYTRKPIIQPR